MRFFKVLVISVLSFANSFTTTAKEKEEEGIASYYADYFQFKQNASGGIHDNNMLVAAHRKLPFGTKVKVTYLKKKKSVIVTITDRGPFVKGRIIDLSKAAAKELGFIKQGLIKVRLEVVKPVKDIAIKYYATPTPLQQLLTFSVATT